MSAVVSQISGKSAEHRWLVDSSKVQQCGKSFDMMKSSFDRQHICFCESWRKFWNILVSYFRWYLIPQKIGREVSPSQQHIWDEHSLHTTILPMFDISLKFVLFSYFTEVSPFDILRSERNDECVINDISKGEGGQEVAGGHDDVIKWKHFPRNWPFVRGIHRSIPRTKASDAELWCFLICVWINDWVNNREAGDLRRYRGHYDVIVMKYYHIMTLSWNYV